MDVSNFGKRANLRILQREEDEDEVEDEAAV